MPLTLQQHNEIKTQADAVIYFLQRLDIEMIDAILDNNRTYQDFPKPVFIEKLGEALNELIFAGDTYLEKYPGYCNHQECNYKCEGFSFVGNKSGNYLDLIVVINSGKVIDIYECSFFHCTGYALKKNFLIEIDKFELPF